MRITEEKEDSQKDKEPSVNLCRFHDGLLNLENRTDQWQFILVEKLYCHCHVILQLWTHIVIRDS